MTGGQHEVGARSGLAQGLTRGRHSKDSLAQQAKESRAPPRASRQERRAKNAGHGPCANPCPRPKGGHCPGRVRCHLERHVRHVAASLLSSAP